MVYPLIDGYPSKYYLAAHGQEWSSRAVDHTSDALIITLSCYRRLLSACRCTPK